MARPSKYEEVSVALKRYLEAAETDTVAEYPLDIKSIAIRLGVSRTTLYTYQFDQEIRAAEKRRSANQQPSTEDIERQTLADTIQKLRGELAQAQERNKNLLGVINIIEANAVRIGMDPEELYRPIPKPLRQVTRAGHGMKRAKDKGR